MAETSLDKELDNMEQVTEGSNAVTKDAKPGEKIDTSKGGAEKVVDVTSIPWKVQKALRMLAHLLPVKVSKAPVPAPNLVTHPQKWRT